MTAEADAAIGGVPAETPIYRLPIASLDFEATGLAAWRDDEVCEVGLIGATGSATETLLSTFVNPGKPIPPEVQELTGIRDLDVGTAPGFAEVFPALLAAIGSRALVIHNAPFDLAFIRRATRETGQPMIPNLTIDTLLLSRFLNGGRESNSLGQICLRHGLERGRSHRAAEDARAAAQAYDALVPYLEARGVRTVRDLVLARLAAPASVFVDKPSSVLLDMLSRAIESHSRIVATVEEGAGSQLHEYALLPLELADDRTLIAQVVEGARGVGEERAFHVRRIMLLDFEDRIFRSAWLEAGRV